MNPLFYYILESAQLSARGMSERSSLPVCHGRPCDEIPHRDIIFTPEHNTDKMINLISKMSFVCTTCNSRYWKCLLCTKTDHIVRYISSERDRYYYDRIVQHVESYHSFPGITLLPIYNGTLCVKINWRVGLLDLRRPEIQHINFDDILEAYPHLGFIGIRDFELLMRGKNDYVGYINAVELEDTLTDPKFHVTYSRRSVILHSSTMDKLMNLFSLAQWECVMCGGEFDCMPSFEVYYMHLAVHTLARV